MSDLMRWMYEHYIRPQIESQPKDFGEVMQLDLLNNVLDANLQKTLQAVLAFYSVQGFRLGVRTGAALQSELSQETKYLGSTCSHSHTPFSER